MNELPARSAIDVPLLLPEQAARRLGVSVDTLRKMIQAGLITAIKWPGNVRVDPAEIERFELSHATEARVPTKARSPIPELSAIERCPRSSRGAWRIAVSVHAVYSDADAARIAGAKEGRG
jgi:excisionase family DNA binding protein